MYKICTLFSSFGQKMYGPKVLNILPLGDPWQLLNCWLFAKMQKNYFMAQESPRYSVRKQDWFFCFLCIYKNVSQKTWFLHMTENYDDCHQRKKTRTFIYKKSKNNCQTFLYTKSETLFKKLDNFRYAFISKKLYTWRSVIFMKF